MSQICNSLQAENEACYLWKMICNWFSHIKIQLINNSGDITIIGECITRPFKSYQIFVHVLCKYFESVDIIGIWILIIFLRTCLSNSKIWIWFLKVIKSKLIFTRSAQWGYHYRWPQEWCHYSGLLKWHFQMSGPSTLAKWGWWRHCRTFHMWNLWCWKRLVMFFICDAIFFLICW